jgi:hypothetical protein
MCAYDIRIYIYIYICIYIFMYIYKPSSYTYIKIDEHFAKEGLRLAQLTNKCMGGDDDLEYFIAESGMYMYINIYIHIYTHICIYKCIHYISMCLILCVHIYGFYVYV